MKNSIQFKITASLDIETVNSLTSMFGGYIYHISPRVLVWRNMHVNEHEAANIVAALIRCDVIAYDRTHAPVYARQHDAPRHNTPTYAVDYYDGKRRHFKTFTEVIADKKIHPTAMYFWDPHRKKRVYFVEFSTTDARKCPCDIR